MKIIHHDFEVSFKGRDIELLEYLCAGASNKQIAHDLDLSPNTVKNYVERILEKLGANNRTQAVRIAMDHSLVCIRRVKEIARRLGLE